MAPTPADDLMPRGSWGGRPARQLRAVGIISRAGVDVADTPMSPRAGVHAAGAVTTSPGLTKRVMITARLAGATAWAGSELARGIAGALDVSLVAAIACRDAGRALGEALDEPRLTARIHATAAEALAAHPPGVLVEYTRPVVAKDWVLHAPTTDSRSVSRQFHTATSIHVAPFTRTDRLVAGESRRAFDRAGAWRQPRCSGSARPHTAPPRAECVGRSRGAARLERG